MAETELIPHLFRTEYRKIVAVLCASFGIEHLQTAEDLASDTFLAASQTWGLKGLPENPVAWLYAVAKNKTRDHLRRHNLYVRKISRELKQRIDHVEEKEIDLSPTNISDSELAMFFVCCHPLNPPEAQMALALNLLMGFGAHEIARALLTTRDVIYKRLQRAKQRLKEANVTVAAPSQEQIRERLPGVLKALYLLFNEGYFSAHPDHTVRKDLCMEAINLTSLLMAQAATNLPSTRALLSLMCLQASRLDARIAENGAVVLYHDQDRCLWDQHLIKRGKYLLDQACQGTEISRYHLEAGIAWWHTVSEDTPEKWEQILQLYNHLLCIEYSPVAALNRTYALFKVHGKNQAIKEAEKIDLKHYHLYYLLLAELYQEVDNIKARWHLQQALSLASTTADKRLITARIEKLDRLIQGQE